MMPPLVVFCKWNIVGFNAWMIEKKRSILSTKIQRCWNIKSKYQFQSPALYVFASLYSSVVQTVLWGVTIKTLHGLELICEPYRKKKKQIGQIIVHLLCMQELSVQCRNLIEIASGHGKWIFVFFSTYIFRLITTTLCSR